MNKMKITMIKTLIITVIIMLVIQLAEGLPWWFFVIPVMIFGIYISIRKWNVRAFPVGFSAGFLVWFAGNLYFHLTYNGIVLKKIGLLLSVPTVIVLLVAGIIGGLIAGLALYTGQHVLSDKNYSHNNNV